LTEKLSTGLSEEEADFMKTMQEIDTIYQSEMSRAKLIGRQEGEAIGRQEGKAIGRQEQGLIFVMRLLNRRLINISGDLPEKIKALPLERLEALGEDCLDFEQLSDLMSWLARNER
jgi:predicted transposase YdaD